MPFLLPDPSLQTQAPLKRVQPEVAIGAVSMELLTMGTLGRVFFPNEEELQRQNSSTGICAESAPWILLIDKFPALDLYNPYQPG